MMRTRDWYWPITAQQQFPQATEQASKMEEVATTFAFAISSCFFTFSGCSVRA